MVLPLSVSVVRYTRYSNLGLVTTPIESLCLKASPVPGACSFALALKEESGDSTANVDGKLPKYNHVKMKIAVTGHRPDRLGGYDADDNFRAIRRHMRGFLQGVRLGGVVDVTLIAGGALGIDQFWMEVGLHMGLSVTAALPFEGYDSRWPVASRQKYAKLLDKCSDVRYVCEPGYDPAKLQRRNEWMVDQCDLLVAYWAGTRSGGTSNCITYAEQQNCDREVFYLQDIIS